MPEIIGIISKLAGRSVAALACPCSALSCLSHQRGPSRHLPALHSKTGFCSHLLLALIFLNFPQCLDENDEAGRVHTAFLVHLNIAVPVVT